MSTGAASTFESSSSPVESVLFMISETVLPQFSLKVSKSTGVGALKNPLVTFGTSFVDEFPVGTDSVFVDFFRVKRGCEHF